MPTSGQTVALMAIGFLASLGLGLGLLSGCKEHANASADPERWDRQYIAFVDNELMPLAKRDGQTHMSGGCDVGATDLLCVECFEPFEEDWIRCQGDGCHFVQTTDEFAETGADISVCSRWEARNGLSVSFTRRPH